ncbi:hypothetical protein PspCFBP13528_20885 [Pseudomonas sp. CFBP13528]|uniref:hypothetical protein n=1 Tax=Pseudomonas sp. CFBP13528 TaxID=2184006 RepID=UPI0010C05101|nr:hypothetical protein [Pseudomonas sp. CFBP13528]TKK28093.1 hypothetical protein PspCFBP13528_20885 [Pseudomonas sp. CFBP13528]
MEEFGFAKGYAQISYERLILIQSKIEFGGLWQLNGNYYIVCVTLDEAVSSEGLPLKRWFDDYCRMVAYQVDLVKSPPQGATRIPARTAKQLSQLHGVPLNISEFHRELRRQLPRFFTAFKIDDHPTFLRIISPVRLDGESRQLIKIAIANLGISIRLEFQVNPGDFPGVHAPDFYFVDQRLKGWPSKLVTAQELSEQQWFDDRLSLFSTEQMEPSRYIPSVGGKQAACFIDCLLGRPSNIRNYLTTYNSIYISPPFSDLDSLLESFSITIRELVSLINTGRVIIVLPAELHFYDREMLATLLDHDQSKFVLNKQLAAATVADGRKRNPLLYPALDNEGRRYLLDLLGKDSIGDGFSGMQSVRKYLGSSWASLEADYSTQGARAGLQHGMGRLLAEIISGKSGKYINPIILECSTSVDWAAALNANYCPVKSDGFDIEPLVELSASFITGVPRVPIIDTASHLGVVVEELLVLDGDTPIRDVTSAFSFEDVYRLNCMLKEQGFSAEAVGTYVAVINDKVKALEKVERGAKKRDLLTLTAALAPALMAGPAAAWVPVAVWFIQRMLNNDSRVGDPVSDWLRAKNAFTTSDAVFVSRLRKKE